MLYWVKFCPFPSSFALAHPLAIALILTLAPTLALAPAPAKVPKDFKNPNNKQQLKKQTNLHFYIFH